MKYSLAFLWLALSPATLRRLGSNTIDPVTVPAEPKMAVVHATPEGRYIQGADALTARWKLQWVLAPPFTRQ